MKELSRIFTCSHWNQLTAFCPAHPLRVRAEGQQVAAWIVHSCLHLVTKMHVRMCQIRGRSSTLQWDIASTTRWPLGNDTGFLENRACNSKSSRGASFIPRMLGVENSYGWRAWWQEQEDSQVRSLPKTDHRQTDGRILKIALFCFHAAFIDVTSSHDLNASGTSCTPRTPASEKPVMFSCCSREFHCAFDIHDIHANHAAQPC